MHSKTNELTSLSHRALQCRYCFEHLGLSAPLIDIAQPRWVGPQYWESTPRILILMLNPGAGGGRQDGADDRFRKLLHAFNRGSATLNDIFEHQHRDMPNWGRQGRFCDFYLKGLSLNLSDVAFGNIAWCPTKGDKYPMKMLRHCFLKHTSILIQTLDPNIILLSGSNTHRFSKEIQKERLDTRIIKTLHYAHRKGSRVQQEELFRIKECLREYKPAS